MSHFLMPDSNANDALLSPRISYVFDTNGSSTAPVAAKDFLTGLDAGGLALLRRTDHQLRRNGQPKFRCGFCKEPVHIRVISVAESGYTDGRRACFVHDPRPEERDCPFGDFGSGSSAAEIDGGRFQGRQEGARHKFLKTALCEMLRADPNIATADCEVLVTGLAADGRSTWRRPDVFGMTKDGRHLALDVQLASPLLETIDGREQFYSAQKIAWHWVVDPEQPYRLQRQGFQDLILPQGGKVLGFSEAAQRLAKTDMQSRFYLLDVVEAAGHQGFDVSRRVINLDTALRLAGLPKGGASRFATDLRAVAFLRAIRGGHTSRAERIFDLLAASCGVPNWMKAQNDGLAQTVDILIALLTEGDEGAVKAGMQKFLGVSQPGGQPAVAFCNWAFLIVRIAETDIHIRKRIIQSFPNARALIEAVLSNPKQRANSKHLWEKWRPMMHRLFPRLAA